LHKNRTENRKIFVQHFIPEPLDFWHPLWYNIFAEGERVRPTLSAIKE
jgi:hypothetical protein